MHFFVKVKPELNGSLLCQMLQFKMSRSVVNPMDAVCVPLFLLIAPVGNRRFVLISRWDVKHDKCFVFQKPRGVINLNALSVQIDVDRTSSVGWALKFGMERVNLSIRIYVGTRKTEIFVYNTPFNSRHVLFGASFDGFLGNLSFVRRLISTLVQ